MNNYHYLIAGFPNLVLDYTNHKISYHSMRDQIIELCSKKDIRLIDWLEFGLKEENLSHHFYRAAIKTCKNKFIQRYYSFDLQLRNAQVIYLSRKNNKSAEQYLLSTPQDFGLDPINIENLLEISNILEREQLVDKLRWDAISEMVAFEYFSIDVILAFLAKLRIVDRWNELDKEVGAKMFKKLVDEVKGTFKGVDF